MGLASGTPCRGQQKMSLGPGASESSLGLLTPSSWAGSRSGGADRRMLCVQQVTAQSEHVRVASDQGTHTAVGHLPRARAARGVPIRCLQPKPPAPVGSNFLSWGALSSTVQGQSGPVTRRLQGDVAREWRGYTVTQERVCRMT